MTDKPDHREKATKDAMDALKKARSDIGEENLRRVQAILNESKKQKIAPEPEKKLRSADEVAAEILAMVSETKH